MKAIGKWGMFSLSRMVKNGMTRNPREKNKAGQGHRDCITSPLIYSFNNLSVLITFSSSVASSAEIPLCKHQQCWCIEFCSNPNFLMFPLIRDTVLTTVMNKRRWGQRPNSEKLPDSQIATCFKVSSPPALCHEVIPANTQSRHLLFPQGLPVANQGRESLCSSVLIAM